MSTHVQEDLPQPGSIHLQDHDKVLQVEEIA